MSNIIRSYSWYLLLWEPRISHDFTSLFQILELLSLNLKVSTLFSRCLNLLWLADYVFGWRERTMKMYCIRAKKYVKVKIKVLLLFVVNTSIRRMECRGTTPPRFYLNTRWKCVVSFTSWSLYHGGAISGMHWVGLRADVDNLEKRFSCRCL